MIYMDNIANFLGVSRMTLYRRRREYGLLVDPENTLTDCESETVLRQMRVDHPALGETIWFKAICVQWAIRLQESG